jgi:hypothetical protein
MRYGIKKRIALQNGWYGGIERYSVTYRRRAV